MSKASIESCDASAKNKESGNQIGKPEHLVTRDKRQRKHDDSNCHAQYRSTENYFAHSIDPRRMLHAFTSIFSRI
jgi:hypothetical protein